MRGPRIPEALLRVFVADRGLEEAILGDLAEEWSERAGRGGVVSAYVWYWGQVLRSVPHLLRDRFLRRLRRVKHDPLAETDPSTLEEAMTKDSPAYRLAARPLLAAAIVLTAPLVAMQLTHGVVWTLSDFVIMGALVFGTGLTFELALTRTESTAYRAAAGVALAAGFLLVWVNLAVGVIGSAANDANLMYLWVLAVGVGGAIGAGFEPRGMARAMAATAVALLAVGAIAVAGGLGGAASGPIELLALNGFFAALFLGSALLFRSSERTRPDGVARAGG